MVWANFKSWYMNHRTLNKEHSIHVVLMGCMLLSWGVTCYYFDNLVPNGVISDLSKVLLYPVKLTDNLLGNISNFNISGHPLWMFMVLWITYSIPALQLYPVFMIKNHGVSDLKSWYAAKMNFSK